MKDIKQLGSILGIWAHPDDETFMAGSMLAAASANGQKVSCVTATKGEGGVRDELRWPASQLGEIRSAELAAALEILGVTEQTFLSYLDGGCKDVDEVEAIEKIVTLIDKYQPDSIITFAPDGLTGHPDHIAVSNWATKAAAISASKPLVYYAIHTAESYESGFKQVSDQFNIYFATETPNVIPEAECVYVHNLNDEQAWQKIRALQAMPSQYDIWFEALGTEGVKSLFQTEALVLSK